jgi:DNA-binding transcriptional ArsR family regulator
MSEAGNFFLVDNILVDHYARLIGPHAYAVLTVLKRHADVKGSCYPSVALIAGKLGLSTRQVTRAIKTLEAYNMVTVRRRRGQGSVYRIARLKAWRRLDSVELADKGVDWDVDWPSGVFKWDFPDKPLTCSKLTHTWEEDGHRCGECGLLRSEEYYKEMCGYGMAAGPFLPVAEIKPLDCDGCAKDCCACVGHDWDKDTGICDRCGGINSRRSVPVDSGHAVKMQEAYRLFRQDLIADGWIT